MPVRIKRGSTLPLPLSQPKQPPRANKPAWTVGYRFKARTGTNTYDFELINANSMIAIMVESRNRAWFVEEDRKHLRLAATSVRAEIL